MKKLKHEAHTARTQRGSGDFYGSGIKQPMGKHISSYMDAGKPTPTQLKKAPKSLA